jgi:hypothetical protein
VVLGDDGDDGGPASADRGGDAEAVELRHLDVEEDDVPRSECVRVDRGERADAVARFADDDDALSRASGRGPSRGRPSRSSTRRRGRRS